MSRLISASIHAVIVSLLIAFGSAIHPLVARQSHVEHLVFMPIPTVRPVRLSTALVSAQSTVARLAVGKAASHEATPSLVKLDISSPLELPQVAQRTVSAAPVARQVGFDQQSGVIGYGNGHGVTVGGFGSQGTGTTRRSGNVKLASFDRQPAPAAVRTTGLVSTVQPATVTSIPGAHYTPEARSAGITGQVVLRVCFKADGSVQVIGVTQGLGYGLDEVARQVAAGVVFAPEMRNGAPVDSVHTVSIRFQLSS